MHPPILSRLPGQDPSAMNLSGIFITTAPEHLNAVCNSLNALDGIEVFHTDTEKGHIVIVQEADTVKDEVAGLKHIKTLPHIALAEMVHHYVGDSDDISPITELPDDLDNMTGLGNAVPAYLNN